MQYVDDNWLTFNRLPLPTNSPRSSARNVADADIHQVTLAVAVRRRRCLQIFKISAAIATQQMFGGRSAASSRWLLHLHLRRRRHRKNLPLLRIVEWHVRRSGCVAVVFPVRQQESHFRSVADRNCFAGPERPCQNTCCCASCKTTNTCTRVATGNNWQRYYCC